MPTEQAYPNGRCCVFQSFDGAEYDSRYDEVIFSSIERAGLEPYRGRDTTSTIPIDTLHREIRNAAICIADITTRSPNVMYELGFAIAAGKDVVILCGPSSPHFPFDIHHRAIITYRTTFPGDFKVLGSRLTVKLNTLIAAQEKTPAFENVYAQSQSHAEPGLSPHESTALALLLVNQEIQNEHASASFLKEQMRKAGYNAVRTRMAVARLVKLDYAKIRWGKTYHDEAGAEIRLTGTGKEWFLRNQTEFLIRTTSHVNSRYASEGAADADMPV